jgi:hypothetical protein
MTPPRGQIHQGRQFRSTRAGAQRFATRALQPVSDRGISSYTIFEELEAPQTGLFRDWLTADDVRHSLLLRWHEEAAHLADQDCLLILLEHKAAVGRAV